MINAVGCSVCHTVVWCLALKFKHHVAPSPEASHVEVKLRQVEVKFDSCLSRRRARWGRPLGLWPQSTKVERCTFVSLRTNYLKQKKMPNPPDTLIHHTAPADARIFLLCHTANANVTHSHRVSINGHSDKNDGEDDG